MSTTRQPFGHDDGRGTGGLPPGGFQADGVRGTRRDAFSLVVGAACIMAAALVLWQGFGGPLGGHFLGIAIPVMLMILGGIGLWGHYRARTTPPRAGGS